MDTEEVWPAGTRAGMTALAQVIRYRVRLAARTDRIGRMISTPPMLSRVRWPSPRPSTPAAAPAATNALPRVVNPANIDRMRRPSSTLLFSTYGRADVHANDGPLSGVSVVPLSAAGAAADARRSRPVPAPVAAG